MSTSWSSIHAIAVSRGKRWLAAGDDSGRIAVWTVGSLVEMLNVVLPVGDVRDLAFAPDELSLAVAGGNGRLMILDVTTGASSHTFVGDFPIKCCAYTSDGTIVVAGDTAGRVHRLRIAGS
jgi:WD40 repeat protein